MSTNWVVLRVYDKANVASDSWVMLIPATDRMAEKLELAANISWQLLPVDEEFDGLAFAGRTMRDNRWWLHLLEECDLSTGDIVSLEEDEFVTHPARLSSWHSTTAGQVVAFSMPPMLEVTRAINLEMLVNRLRGGVQSAPMEWERASRYLVRGE